MAIREYARHRGVNQKAVQVAIKDGRISGALVAVGKKNKINPDLADKLWNENTQANNANAHLRGEEGRVLPKKDEQQSREPTIGPSYAQSRALKEAFLARLAQLDYEKRVGTLIDADDIAKVVSTIGRTARDSLMSLPDKLAPILSNETDIKIVRKILNEEIRLVCNEMSRSLSELSTDSDIEIEEQDPNEE